MPPARHAGLAGAASLLLAILALPAPAVAADSPEAAIEGLFEAVEAGDFEGLESLVCEAQRDAVRETFDPTAQLGVGSDAVEGLGAALTFRVEDRAVELLSQDDASATARVTGTMTIELASDDPEGVLRAMLEAEMGADVSDEEIEAMLPFMEMAFGQELPVDEEVELVVEDGEWVVCGGLGQEPEEPAVAPNVSLDGVCGYVSPDELSAVTELSFDSSNGFETFCSYSTSDFESYHATSVTLQLNDDAERMGGAYGADQPMEVGGNPAFASGPEAFGHDLITQVGDDVLMVNVSPPDPAPEGFDPLAHAVAVTELFLPLVPEIRLDLAGPTAEPTPVPTPSVSLCEMVTVEALNEATDLGFDEGTGDAMYCSYYSTDGEPGFHGVTIGLNEIRLEDYQAFLPETTETTVADAAALEMPGQLLVELPGGAFVLTVAGFLDPADESTEMTDAAMLRTVAELALPTVVAPEPTVSVGESSDDTGTAEQASAVALPRPMCEYLDLEAVNGLGVVQWESSDGFLDEQCWLTSAEGDAVSAFLDGIGIDEVRSFYSDGEDLTVAGMPAFLAATDLRVETSAGPVGFSAFLLASGMEPRDVLIPVAELVVSAIEADTGGG